MTARSSPPNRPFRAKLRELGLLSREQEAGLPQFLMLAAECNSARSLAQILQRHPGCGLPDALGTQFFSSRHQYCNLDWYVRTLGHDRHLVRGEWTPSYSLMPVKTIRLIQELLPQLKLVFLLRDPAVEAWSAWQESLQTGRLTDAVPGTWPWARADLLGQLRRWRSVFPLDQFFIGFDEQFRTGPVSFLKDLCAFLGIEPPQPELRDKLQPVEPDEVPAIEASLLRKACRWRIEELAAFLRKDFRQNVPAYWTAPPVTNLDSDRVAELAQTFSSVVKHEFDDVFLFRAVEYHEGNSPCILQSPTAPAQASQNTGSRSAGFTLDKLTVRGDVVPRLVREGYRGFNVVAFRREFIAIPQAAGEVDLSRMNDAALDKKVNAREFLRIPSLGCSEHAIDEYLAAVEIELDSVSTPHGTEGPPRSAA